MISLLPQVYGMEAPGDMLILWRSDRHEAYRAVHLAKRLGRNGRDSSCPVETTAERVGVRDHGHDY